MPCWAGTLQYRTPHILSHPSHVKAGPIHSTLCLTLGLRLLGLPVAWVGQLEDAGPGVEGPGIAVLAVLGGLCLHVREPVLHQHQGGLCRLAGEQR